MNKKKIRKVRKSKILYSAKPSVFSYFLFISIPFLIFITDDWPELFSKWDFTTFDWGFKLLTILIFFGLPIIGLLSIRTTNFYIDRIEFKHEITGGIRIRYYENLIYWRQLYVPNTLYTPSHEIIELKFSFKKFSISSLSVQDFSKLKLFLSERFNEIEKK